MTSPPATVVEKKSEEGSSRADIVLVSMPFGPIQSPSLGLSLLKSSLEDKYRVNLLYLGLPFADQIGPRLYDWISSGNPSALSLIGEWVFSPALFPDHCENEDDFFALIQEHAGSPLEPATLEGIRAARQAADAYVELCVQRILSQSPSLVGFTSVFQQHVASIAVAQRIRRADESTTLVFGGANCEGVMGAELVRRFPFIDAVVSGEGERVFPELVDRAFKQLPLGDLAGVWAPPGRSEARDASLPVEVQQAPSVQHLDDLPLPDFSDFFQQWEGSQAKNELAGGLLFETSRGCWWGQKQHCTFCGLNGLGMGFRSKSPQRAMDELRSLHELYPDYPIQVVDNILDMAYFRNFLPELAKFQATERNQPLELFYEVKANLRKEQLELLRRAGVTKIQPGIESLSDHVLQLMGKGVQGLQNVQLLKWCKELGILPYWNILFGFPGEEPEDYQRMAKWIPALSHLQPPTACNPLRLDRFSPNFERSEELGFATVEPAPAYRYIYPFDDASLLNIAYYFVYQYQDGRDPMAYARPLTEAVERWKRDAAKSELVALEKSDQLLLWDFRPIAKRKLTFLSGLQRALYQACDRVAGESRLIQLATRLTGRPWSSDELRETLNPLLDDALMLHHENRYLSLATPMAGSSTA